MNIIDSLDIHVATIKTTNAIDAYDFIYRKLERQLRLMQLQKQKMKEISQNDIFLSSMKSLSHANENITQNNEFCFKIREEMI